MVWLNTTKSPTFWAESVTFWLSSEMPRLSETDRHLCLALNQAGFTSRQIATRLNCNQSTVIRLVQRNQHTGSVADRPRPGQPRVTTPADDRHIVLAHLRNRFLPASETARALRERRGPVAPNTVRNRLSAAGLQARRPYVGPPLTAQRRLRRLQWARAHHRITRLQWNSVLFTDESRFSMSVADGRIRVWRRAGERYADACVIQHDRFGGGSVHVWGGISFNHRTQLHVFHNRVNAQTYIDQVLAPIVVPAFQAHNDLLVLQHDNARPHTARVTTQYLANQNINVMDWPAFSPDMNPIEHIWDALGRRVRAQGPFPNLRQLEVTLVQEWNNLPQQLIQDVIGSMRRRLTSWRPH